MNVYFIGGSPCSGKSTVAEILSQKFGLYYFKVDDHLERYTRLGAKKGYPVCRKQIDMSTEEIWMREPEVQCEEELRFYEEIFGFILDDLKQPDHSRGIITEGAAYLPNLMKDSNIPNHRYLALTPTKDFQIFHYSKRDWVPHVLAQCSDRDKAFRNWMERDILFAKEIRQRCHAGNYVSLVNQGDFTAEELAGKVIAHFGLGE